MQWHTLASHVQQIYSNVIIQREKLCKNCFKPNHDTSRCPSAKSCQIFHQRHHTLLHSYYLDRQSQHPQTNFSANKQCNKTLLATAVVKTNWKGCDYFLRALIDQGSQSSFITEDAVQRLQLQRKRANASITGLGATHAGTANSKVELQIQSIYPSEFQSWGEFLVLKNLTRLLPEESFTTKDWNHIKHLPLADPAYNKKAAIDMLIGADVFQDIILEGVIKGNHDTPVAQNTQLGWISSGSIQHRFKKHEATVCLISNTELNDQLKSFWEIEEVQEQIGPSEEETRCEEILFRTTHKRNEEGRYIVRLPFKEDTCKLGESKDRALARFLQIEKKFF